MIRVPLKADPRDDLEKLCATCRYGRILITEEDVVLTASKSLKRYRVWVICEAQGEVTRPQTKCPLYEELLVEDDLDEDLVPL